MSVVQNKRGTGGGVTGRGFVPGRSGNPGERPKGLTRRVRELVGDDGTAIAEFMYSVMVDESTRMADRLEGARWLADRGFGKPPQDVELALKGQETVDLHAFAAFAAKYLPLEMLDELILSVEAKMGGSRGAGVESTFYEVRARLVSAKLEEDNDIHLVIRGITTALIGT